jgi:hypothetical protein
MPNIPGIEKIRSPKTNGSRSVPPHMNGPYVKMFMLNNERERLEKEAVRLCNRIESIADRLKEIGEEMKSLRKQETKSEKKRKFDWDNTRTQSKEVTNSEEPQKQKVETGWKIKTLNRKKQVF